MFTSHLLASLVLATFGCRESATGPVPVASVSVTLGNTSLMIGQTTQAVAALRDGNGNLLTGRPIAWTTSAAGVATVSASGLVGAVGAGTATITGTSEGKGGAAGITVDLPIASVQIDKPELLFDHFGLQDTLRATARDSVGNEISGARFAWESSNASVVTVDRNGVVTSLYVGSAQVTATAGGKIASIPATVQLTSPQSTLLCSGGTPTVLLLVDAQLRLPLTMDITRFANDLCSDGYRVWLDDSVPPSPPEIRAYLADAWTRSGQTLVGAMLIGNIPHAYQFVTLHSTNPQLPDVREEAISFQYYADVNGDFGVSPGYTGGHQYSYDLHSGDVSWELWIGVLPVYQGSLAATVDALRRYFEKNHAYRTGGPKPPRAFLEVNELQSATTVDQDAIVISGMREGTYSWTPFSNSSSAHLYFNTASAGLSIQEGYAALSAGVADFTVGDSHGDWGAAGLLTIAWVQKNPVNTVFFWSSGCAIGDLDHADNFLTSVLYSPTSAVLVAKGTTNNSGGMGNNQNGFYGHNVATAMAAGTSFGGAVLGHANTPLLYPWSADREFLLGTPVILGDPTLRLRP